MKNKNGFTLVELLAVIVILAVVMLIAVVSIGPMMEKSRKSSLGDEGLSATKAAEAAFQEEQLKGAQALYKSTDDVCYTLSYLCKKGFFEKGCGDDGYTGSVLVRYTGDGNYKYYFWISNGTYSFDGASIENYGDIENADVVFDGTHASIDCGNNDNPSEKSESETITNEIFNSDNKKIYYPEVNPSSGETTVTTSAKKITFTMKNQWNENYTMTAEQGMTWREWINSTTYNTMGVKLRESCSGDKKYYGVVDYPCWLEINPNEALISGNTYNYVCTWNGTPNIADLHLCS